MRPPPQEHAYWDGLEGGGPLPFLIVTIITIAWFALWFWWSWKR